MKPFYAFGADITNDNDAGQRIIKIILFESDSVKEYTFHAWYIVCHNCGFVYRSKAEINDPKEGLGYILDTYCGKVYEIMCKYEDDGYRYYVFHKGHYIPLYQSGLRPDKL